MKKLCTVLSIICMCFLVFACGKQPNISCTLTEITVNMGTPYVFREDTINISNSKSGYQLEILDTNIATVEGLKITPKSEGETKIIISLIDNNSIRCEVDLIVTDIVYADNISIAHEEIELNLRVQPTIINKITLNKGCNEIPEIEYNPAGIVEYDYITGKVTAKGVGLANVIIYYRNCNVGFKAKVTDLIYTTTLSVNDNVVMLGSNGMIDFDCYPNFANTYKFYTNSDILTIDEMGNYQAIALGVADVYYEYITAENATPIVGAFKVNVIEPITLFDATILDENYKDLGYYLIEKPYKIVVDLHENISPKHLLLSSNVIVYDGLGFRYEQGYGWVANIFFKKYLDNEIVVTYQYGAGEQNSLTRTIDVHVSGYKDFCVMAKCNGMKMLRNEDGASFIYDLGINNSNPIFFYWQVNDKQIDYDMAVYYLDNGNKVYLADCTYTPHQAGEITLYFELDEELKESVKIIAQGE